MDDLGNKTPMFCYKWSPNKTGVVGLGSPTTNHGRWISPSREWQTWIWQVCSPDNGKVGNQVVCPHFQCFGSYFDVIFLMYLVSCGFSFKPTSSSSSSTQFIQEWVCKNVVVKHSINQSKGVEFLDWAWCNQQSCDTWFPGYWFHPLRRALQGVMTLPIPESAVPNNIKVWNRVQFI